MSTQSPSAQLIAKANREQAKLAKVYDELQLVVATIKHSELPGDVKFRLYAALKDEHGLLEQERDRLSELKKGAEISRGKQWVTSGDQ